MNKVSKNEKENNNVLDTEMYTFVCKDRFADIDMEIAQVRNDTQYLRRKIDNGLSSLPKKMNWIQATFITMLIATIAGFGIWTYNMGKLEATIRDHINFTSSPEEASE